MTEMKEVRKVDINKLWDYALHGSPVVSAMALAILDRLLDGKISELKKRIKEGTINE